MRKRWPECTGLSFRRSISSAHRHKHLDEKRQYRKAIDALAAGGLVALPTDTVYGLCAVAADDAAVRRLYDVKARPAEQPLPLFVASVEQAELVAEMNDAARALAASFWPGAMTIVLRRRASYRTLAAGGGDTIGVRVPEDAAIREIAAQLGPLTGTSANRSGAPEARSAREVEAQLDGDIDVIVDAPVPRNGRTSTVVDCSDAAAVRVVREGAIGRPAIVDALAGLATLI